ncbi:MAG: PAS domain-containing protein, partial [Magnetococcales bacterium]|nr:PAS domain-containing protein [Magnetococcales bacterium]
MRRSFRSSLVRRLAIYVGLGMVFVSMLMGVLSYYFFSAHVFAEAISLERQLVQTIASQASVGAFAKNEFISTEVIQGLLLNRFIQGVRISSQDGFSVEQTKKSGLDFADAVIHPLYSPVYPEESIGIIHVILDFDSIRKKSTNEALLNTGLMLFLILIAVIILVTMFHHLLGQPIARLVKEMAEMKPGNGKRLSLDERHVTDEIGLLTRSVNSLMNTTDEALSWARRFSDALDNVSSYIYIKDKNHQYVYANRAVLEFFHCSSEELFGSNDHQFFPQETADKLWEMDNRVLLNGENLHGPLHVHPFDLDSLVFWDVKQPIFDENGEIWGLCGISTDITKRNQLEEQLRQAKEYAEEASRIKGKFLAMMSHEIRTGAFPICQRASKTAGVTAH